MVSIFDDPGVAGALRFTFVPKGVNDVVPLGQPRKHVPEYIVTVAGHGEGTTFTWVAEPDSAKEKAKLEAIAKKRASDRHAWLDLLGNLVTTVQGWAEKLGWVTKRTDKKMEDYEIGNYKAPALLLQRAASRLFLEPVTRAAPGAEGLVDLYRMPAYDDIASLYYYNKRWNVHYLPPGEPAVDNIRDAEAKPLTKEALKTILDEMSDDAG